MSKLKTKTNKGNKMKIFAKQKVGNMRHIYVFGHKILSYKSKRWYSGKCVYDNTNAIFRTSFYNEQNKNLVNLAKNKEYLALITHLFNQDSEFEATSSIMGGGMHSTSMNTLKIVWECK